MLRRAPLPPLLALAQALRDEFVRRDFLGAGDGGGPAGERPAAIARHGTTGNPLDSGAFLAVHLLRLGQRGGGDQCEGDGDGACRAARGWDSLSPRDRRRGDALARYLAALPTVAGWRGGRGGRGTEGPHRRPSRGTRTRTPCSGPRASSATSFRRAPTRTAW